ncbi:E3 ubiquitin-protein ligase rnf181 [Phtheirospermum japonicum]|uniref:E3 ubiquitin-protein ligase rnf181 n=1 Tax=Phtheirospermum japonicum TaxID=374723 RepID=A0A830CT40_9LAMI|nr:E3 ubiquitin-protein ligase rnf181 [Phtheirospermum japonicum]
MDDTFNRSVSPDCLTPLHLVLPMEKKDKLCRRRLLDFLLFGLPRIRVDDVEGFDLMEACPICMGGPTVGAPVSILPCRHAFHSHCVIRWFMERESCPLCRHEIVLEKVKDLASCYKCDTPPQPNNGIGSFGPSSQPMNDGPSEVVVQEEEMATQRRHKRKRQPSSRLKDYYVTY